MTQDERWMARYNEVKEFIEKNRDLTWMGVV